MKRFLSLLVVCVMLLSMVTISHADEAIEVTYLNADSTKIMVDLSAEVAAADLKAAITLTVDGADVTNFDVVKKAATPPATGGMTESDDYSYVIVPNGGITFDAVYNLKIASSLLGAEYNKYFSVEKLWKESFDSANYTATTFPWKDANGTATLTLETEDTNKVLKVVTGSKYASVLPNKSSTTVFGDTGVAANTYWADNSEARLQENYNVELKVKFDPVPNKDDTTKEDINRSLRVFMQKHGSYWADYSLTGGVAGGARYNKNGNTGAITKAMYAQTGTSKTNLQGAGATSNLVNALGAVTVSEEPFGEGYSTFSMAVKDLSVKVFAGDNAFVNYSYDAAYEATDCGMVSLVSYGTTIFYVDDIVATKMTELELSDITVNHWNADSTKIMLDLSAEVDATALTNALTLTKDGEPVSFTVAGMPSTPEASGGMTASADYSYVIKPQGGITFGSVYELDIVAGLISKNRLSILSNPYNKRIIVEKLWIEDFESEDYATALPWTTAKSDSTIALEEVSGDTMLKITKGSSRDTILPKSNSTTNFADTNTPAETFWATAKNVTDYNVEMNVKFVNPMSSGTTARSLRVSMQKQFQDADQSWVYGIAGGAYYQLKSDGTGLMKNMYAQIGNGQTTANGTKYEGAGKTTTSTNLVSALNPVTVSQEPFGANDSTFTMAVKEQNIKVFAGDAFISYDFAPTISNNGIVGIVPYVASPFYVDDIVVTKAKEAPTSLTFGDLTVTDGADETIDSLTGVSTIDVSVPFTRIGASLPCKVVLAIYGADNSIKNYAFSEVTSFDGAGTIEFNDVATNGGTKLKVFFWENLLTLMPYRATAQWPSAN